MTVLDDSSIASLAIRAGLSNDDAITATAIALAESKGDDAAVGDTALTDAKWGPSYGLWQIRTLKNPGTEQNRDYQWLKVSTDNQAIAMKTISNNGKNWTPWTMYTNGTQLIYRERARKAVAIARYTGSQQPLTGVSKTIADGVDSATGAVDTAKDLAANVADIREFLTKLGDPVFIQRYVKVVGGGTVALAGLVLLNRDLLGGVVKTAAQVVPVGRVATVAGGAAKAAGVKGASAAAARAAAT